MNDCSGKSHFSYSSISSWIFRLSDVIPSEDEWADAREPTKKGDGWDDWTDDVPIIAPPPPVKQVRVPTIAPPPSIKQVRWDWEASGLTLSLEVG